MKELTLSQLSKMDEDYIDGLFTHYHSGQELCVVRLFAVWYMDVTNKYVMEFEYMSGENRGQEVKNFVSDGTYKIFPPDHLNVALVSL